MKGSKDYIFKRIIKSFSTTKRKKKKKKSILSRFENGSKHRVGNSRFEPFWTKTAII